MTTSAFFLSLFCSALLTPASGPGTEPNNRTERLTSIGHSTIGQPAPWFAGWTPSGEVMNLNKLKQRLADGRKRGVVLAFFATWCKSCEQGLAALAKARARLTAAGVDVVLVAHVEPGDPPATIAAWIKDRGLGDVSLVIDRFGAISTAYGVETQEGDRTRISLPLTVVLDATGAVRAIVGSEGDDYVDVLLSALPAATPATTTAP